jgi:hypothetical protein
MPTSKEADTSGSVTYVLPPLLAQHVLSVGNDRGKPPAPQRAGSCAEQTPRTLNSC